MIRSITVVCDRYIYDTVADLATDFGYTAELVRKKIENYSQVFPKPDLVFLIDLPAEVAYRRKDDVPSLDYLRDRRRVYSLLKQEHTTVTIDGTQSVQDIRELVSYTVREML